MVNGELLIKEIQELGIFKKTLAEKMGISRYTLDYKLEHPSAISGNEIYKMADALRIPIGSQKFLDIFFAPEVHETMDFGTGGDKDDTASASG